MSSELQFERLTKAAVAMSYMFSDAKVLIFLHIPKLLLIIYGLISISGLIGLDISFILCELFDYSIFLCIFATENKKEYGYDEISTEN